MGEQGQPHEVSQRHAEEGQRQGRQHCGRLGASGGHVEEPGYGSHGEGDQRGQDRVLHERAAEVLGALPAGQSGTVDREGHGAQASQDDLERDEEGEGQNVLAISGLRARPSHQDGGQEVGDAAEALIEHDHQPASNGRTQPSGPAL